MLKSKLFGPITFFLIFIGIDLYVWQGIKFLMRNASPSKIKKAKIIYWGYSILMYSVFVLIRLIHIQPSAIMKFFGAFVLIIFIVKLIWVVFLLIDDFIRLFRWAIQYATKKEIIQNTTNDGISRLKFLNYMALGIGSLFISSAVWGIFKGAHNYIVRRRTLKIDGLPEAFKGLKIVQISDIHSGSFWDREAVKRGVSLIMNEKADLIFFTGDLVNDTSKEAEDWIDVFKEIKAPMGVYSTLGNHDYGDYVQWETPEAKHQNFLDILQHHKSMGWNLLMDEHRIIEKDGDKIAILGIQNWSNLGKFPKYGNLEKAYKGSEDIPVKLLLSHDPTHWRQQVLNFKPDIKASFAGHTHGLQFGVDTAFYRWSPAKFIYNEWMDLYTENNQHLYVNRGFGYLGYPGRMGIYPEISVFTLV